MEFLILFAYFTIVERVADYVQTLVFHQSCTSLALSLSTVAIHSP